MSDRERQQLLDILAQIQALEALVKNILRKEIQK